MHRCGDIPDSQKFVKLLRQLSVSTIDTATGRRRGENCDLNPPLAKTLSKEVEMRKLINRFRRDEEGAALVEYGMLVGLIAVVCVAVVQGLGLTINSLFSTINADLAPSGLGI